MSTTKDKEELRLELCNWSKEVPVAVQSKGNHYSAKPKARGIKTEADIAGKIGIDPATVTNILDAALSFIRDGYDVELCKAIHIYGCVRSLKTPFVAAKTMGAFRKGVADKAVRPTLAGKPISAEEMLALNKKRKSERVHITPDTVITCNVCGNEMRVCKCLK